MKAVKILPFDFWRLLNSFMKFDPQMPRILLNYFRELEIKIVSDIAWQNGSPVVDSIKILAKSQVENNGNLELDKTMQPFNMFFKRVL